MIFDSDEICNWANGFYGYGQYKAPVWYIGLEEAGGEYPSEVEEKFQYFATLTPNQQLCDIRALHRNVKKTNTGHTFFDVLFGKYAKIQGTWRNLIKFSFGFFQLSTYCPKEAAILDYQKDCLTRIANTDTGNEALIELFPLPNPYSRIWAYNWAEYSTLVNQNYKILLASIRASRKHYQNVLFKGRLRNIQKKIKKYKPKVVLFYGINDTIHKKAIIDTFILTNTTCNVRGAIDFFYYNHTKGQPLICLIPKPPSNPKFKTNPFWFEFGVWAKSKLAGYPSACPRY